MKKNEGTTCQAAGVRDSALVLQTNLFRGVQYLRAIHRQ